MFKSLYKRLMFTYFIIILLTLVLLGILMSAFFQNYLYNNRTEELIREGKALVPYIQLYSIGLINERSLTNYFQLVDRFLNTTIWITDERGIIWKDYTSYEGDIGKWKDQKLTLDEFTQVLEGNTIIRQGYFNDQFSIPVITVGIPLTVNERVTGAIFIHSPIEELHEALNRIYSIIWRSAFFSSILSIVLLYLISKRISNPLIEMNQISREIALGNFKRRVKVTTEDEVGQLGKNFNAMANSLEKLVQMRQSFIANVSHELRTPLTSMRGYIQAVLDKTIDPADQEKYLTIALDETQRLNRLINDLMALAQLESQQFRLNIEAFDINEMIRRVLITQNDRIDAKNMDVNIEFESENCYVEGDHDKIQQVVLNLIDNSVKYSDVNGLLIIKTWKHKDEVFVKIEDRGLGIPKEDIPHLWEPFYQVDKSRSKKAGGTGLGLSIVKNIIDEHGSDIWVNSEEGKGTAFIFSMKPAGKGVGKLSSRH